MYLRPGTKGENKADVRWGEGVFLGLLERSEEYVIGTEK